MIKKVFFYKKQNAFFLKLTLINGDHPILYSIIRNQEYTDCQLYTQKWDFLVEKIGDIWLTCTLYPRMYLNNLRLYPLRIKDSTEIYGRYLCYTYKCTCIIYDCIHWELIKTSATYDWNVYFTHVYTYIITNEVRWLRGDDGDNSWLDKKYTNIKNETKTMKPTWRCVNEKSMS